MKALRIVILLILVSGSAYSQRFADLKNRKGDNAFISNWIHGMVRYTAVSGKYTESFGGFTVNMSVRKDNYEKGEWSWHFENPTLGDLIFLLFNISEMDGRKTEQAFGSGFLGWHQGYVNIVATDRLLISPGISLGDYIFASKREDDSDGARILDPAGYFLHVGPAFKVSYVINNDFWLDGYATYDIGFQVGKPSQDYKQTKGYPRPGFLNIGTEIHHAKTRLFAGARINKMIDTGKSKDSATRFDLSLGYMFGNR